MLLASTGDSNTQLGTWQHKLSERNGKEQPYCRDEARGSEDEATPGAALKD